MGPLEFSRVGRTALQRERIDTTQLAQAAAREARLNHTGPEPLFDIDELPAVDGDATVMRQVWTNLIGNALKYSAKRTKPQIRISGRTENHEAIYQVQDNGAGFDMAYADKLFGVFQRLHSAEDFSGTGVGLAIVQRIIARRGGRVWAQCAPDEGARFEFSLPAPNAPSA